MKVLVTGGTGFIGSFVVEELVSQGHQAAVIANGHQLPKFFESCKGELQYFQGDFGETDVLERALYGCEAVVHLAWSTVPKPTKGATAFEFSSNLSSSINLIEKCIDHDVRKFVFISSGGTVYGVPNSIPITELHSVEPISNYGLSKLTTEKLLHLYYHSHGLNYTVLRVSNAYGERQNLHKNQGVVGHWLKNIFAGRQIEIWGDGSVVRDYIYVKDVAEAIVKALGMVNGAALYNIGSGEGVSLNQIVHEIQTAVQLPFQVTYKPVRNFDVPVNVLDVSKAKNEIGFVAGTSLGEGILNTWNWIQDQKLN